MKKLLMMTALAAFITAPAMANDPAKIDAKIDAKFAKMDKNSDGFISDDEHEDAAEAMFKEADTNKDDKLSKDEMKAYKMKEKAE